MMNSKRMMIVAGGLSLSAFLAFAGNGDIPEPWELIPVNGKYMYNADLGPKKLFWDLWDNYKDEPMFENMWLELSGPYFVLDTLFWLNSDWTKAGFYSAELSSQLKPDKSYSTPHKITEFIEKRKFTKTLDRFKERRPDGPITIAVWNTRPLWALPDYSLSDTVDFLEWKKKYPGFVGLHAYDEWDSDASGIMHKVPALTNHFDRARMAAYSPSQKNEAFRQWIEIDHPKIKSFLFGSDDLCGLVANAPTTCFHIARKGLTFMWYEAELGSTSAPWRWGGMYARGASRQFHVPFGWYTAPFTFNTLCRDGKKPDGYENYITYTKWPNVNNRRNPKYTGAARSLINRNNVYGYLIGTVAQMHEGSSEYLTAFTEKETDKVILSPYGEDQRDLFRWNKTHDRGVLYTPVALLVSMDEVFDRQSYNVQRNHDRFSQTAFLTTLCCPKMKNPASCCNPEKGQQGCMFNSEFGEFCDALCPDSGQRTEEFYKALKNYKAAVFVGWFNDKYFDRDALVRYVKDGGQVFAEKRHVEMGFIPESIPGAKGKIKIVDSFLCDYIRTGTTDWWTDKMPKMYSGEVENPMIKELFRKLQDAFMPIKVEGDIQWGLNTIRSKKEEGRSETGWLLWLINNEGVTKYCLEPEEFDLSKTSAVTVDLRTLKNMKVFDVTDPDPAKVVELEVKDGTFTVSVKPGKDKRISIIDK